MRLACVVVLCAVGAVCGAGTKETTDNRHRRSSGTTGTELFLTIVGERPSSKSNVNTPILPVQLPIQLGGHGGVTLPVLVLPVPVYTRGPDSCHAHHEEAPAQKPAETPRFPNPPPYVALRQQFSQVQSTSNSVSVEQPQEPIQQPLEPVQQPQQPIEQSLREKPAPEIVEVHKAPIIEIPTQGSLNLILGGNKVSFKVDDQAYTPVSPPVPEDESIPFSEGPRMFETSEQMIQSFRRQSPVAPQLPVVIPDLQLPDRIPVPEPSSTVIVPSIQAPSPPRPDFNRSLRLRVDLTVPSSDYTEAYDIEWHADSNTARTMVEDGSTIIYRAPLADGRIQFLEIQKDRTDGKVVRRCTLSPLMPASPADKTFPGLPDFDSFEFDGYTTAEGRTLVERWRWVMYAGPGEAGAARGETLTFNHEMLIIRDRGLAVPLRYTVVTDSSVLGAASDSYTHRYNQLSAPTAAILPDTAKECDLFDELPEENDRVRRDVKGFFKSVVSRFDPIREFAGPSRDNRYDSILLKFKDQFKRKYIDPAEEALRKNLLIKSSRFIEAGNRLTSGFKMSVNFLADRLDDEINQLFGVEELPEGAEELGLVPFPYSDNEVKELSNGLGEEFDWRPLGAVSPVRFQDTTCSSCWAFAVAGSTEGALFKKTNKLVPLSPQCLVDCGKPFGTNGCNGTWPSFAYDYVKARGLPAWDEYTNYQAKVLECKDRSVPPVTHISGHVNVTANSETALKVAIKRHAPNVVIVDAKASSFIYYKSGVLKDRRCGQNKPKLNHAVLAVGWGTKDGPHFIIKNTWTDKWGEGGYIRIAPDSCAVMERPSYALIQDPDIDRENLRAAAANIKEI